MEPLTIAAILALAGAGAKVGSSIWSAKKESDYQKKLEKFNKEEIARYNRGRKTDTLARALLQYSKGDYAPNKEITAPPDAPSMLGPNILAGTGDVLQGAGQAVVGFQKPTAGALPKVAAPVAPSIEGVQGIDNIIPTDAVNVASNYGSAGINAVLRKKALEKQMGYFG